MDAYRIGLPARLDTSSIEALERALAEAAVSDARVWVLEGSTREVFCAGMDLASLASSTDGTAAVRSFARCLGALARAPRPTLAVIEGEALGGGLGLAAACDLALASSAATVGLPEALFGLLPAMIMPALLTRMSAQKARLLALSCASRPAAWAEAAGLFDRVVPAEELAAARRRAERELSRVLPSAVTPLRRLVDAQRRLSFDDGLAEATAIAAGAMANEEIRAHITRFLEEGVAPWAP